jgi:cyclopropane fatty-acyl-phospholipid synthase-like methyltransferase
VPQRAGDIESISSTGAWFTISQMTSTINYWAGLLLGMINVVRHRSLGYRRPRRFAPDQIARSVAYVFEVIARWETRGNIDWSGQRVLELGPGPDLGTGAIILDRGALSYSAIDAFDLVGTAPAEFYDALAIRLHHEIDRSRLSFAQVTFPRLPEVEGKYDLVVSNATLEHIESVPVLFLRLRQLTEEGGRMVHHIDAQTHMRWIGSRDPLNILRYGEWIYRHLLCFPGAPNRMRAEEYVAAAVSAGFDVCAIVPGRIADERYVDQVRPRLARRFRRCTDLSLLTFTLLATAAKSVPENFPSV